MATPLAPAPAPPWYRRTGWIVVLALLLAVAIMAPLTLWANSRPAAPAPSIEITACAIDDSAGRARVSYSVHNLGKRTRSYTIDFDALDSTGARVGTGFGIVSSVPAGGTVRDEATIVLDARGATRCRATHWS